MTVPLFDKVSMRKFTVQSEVRHTDITILIKVVVVKKINLSM